MEYRSGDWFYRDIYVGMSYFVGQEIAAYHEQPVWSMVYAGGVRQSANPDVMVHTVYTILQAALRLAGPEHPYHGPKEYASGGYHYINRVEEPLQVLQDRCDKLIFIPNNQFLASINNKDRMINLWEVRSGTLLQTIGDYTSV